jgi:hypothetical protein
MPVIECDDERQAEKLGYKLRVEHLALVPVGEDGPILHEDHALYLGRYV